MTSKPRDDIPADGSSPDEPRHGEGGEERTDLGAREAQLEAELASAQDRLMRALADQENVRRRAQRAREEATLHANADMARDLLPVIDNLTRALESLPGETAADESLRSLLRGVAAIEREMLQALERHGIRRFNPLGEEFDPNSHHAVSRAVGTDGPEGTVTQVLQPGYRLHDRLLRPAMVVVAGDPASSSPARGHAPHDPKANERSADPRVQ